MWSRHASELHVLASIKKNGGGERGTERGEREECVINILCLWEMDWTTAERALAVARRSGLLDLVTRGGGVQTSCVPRKPAGPVSHAQKPMIPNLLYCHESFPGAAQAPRGAEGERGI